TSGPSARRYNWNLDRIPEHLAKVLTGYYVHSNCRDLVGRPGGRSAFLRGGAVMRAIAFRVAICLIGSAVAAAAAPKEAGSAGKGGAAMPDTPAGKCARAYFDAFNLGEAAVRAFEEKYRAKSALKKRSIDERIAQYGELKDRFGRLEPMRVMDS